MSKAAVTLSWSAASGTYTWSDEQGAERLSLLPDSPAWFAWLAELPSFGFQGQDGSYTARQERRQRGERYWYAYRRTGQQLRKKYLGRTTALTIEWLEQVARGLHAEQSRPLSPDPAFPAHHAPTHRHERVLSPEPQPPEGSPARPIEPLPPHLATKHYVPRLPARLVSRARLIERLSQCLILISAPAGFGKTTLVAEWLADCGVPAAWLSLGEEENDPQRFLSALLAAFQTRNPSLGASVQALLSTPHGLAGLSLSAVFTQLTGELASRQSGEFLLVLGELLARAKLPVSVSLWMGSLIGNHLPLWKQPRAATSTFYSPSSQPLLPESYISFTYLKKHISSAYPTTHPHWRAKAIKASRRFFSWRSRDRGC